MNTLSREGGMGWEYAITIMMAIYFRNGGRDRGKWDRLS